MKDAPFVEQLVPADSKEEAAIAARARLQAVLDQLDPAAGKTLSPANETVAQNRARKRAERQKQRQKQGKAGRRAQPQ
jgi:hypothetical protein